MDSKKSNKIRDIVRLQQILKKWRKNANASKNNNNNNTNSNITYTNTNSNTTCINTSTTNNSANKGIKFLKKTLSFSDNTFSSVSSSTENNNNNNSHVPKGYLAVCVGKELKRYVIPTDYLGHQAFGILLREAEEEFGFHQEGVLKIPCDVQVFEKILKMVQHNKNSHKNNMNEYYLHHVDSFEFHASDIDVMSSSLSTGCCSPDSEQLLQPSLPQLCR